MGRTSDARRRLMDAAGDLIWESSYGAVTIDAICARAGVKKGSFYYFFTSKSDLAIAAIEAWWEERQRLMEKLFRAEVPPLDRIRSYLDHVAQLQIEAYAANGKVLGCPLFSLGSEIGTQDEKIRSLIHHILTTGSLFFLQAIQDAQAMGEIENSDPAAKARSLLTYYEGVLTRGRIENDLAPIRTMSLDAIDLIQGRHFLAAA